MLLKAQSLFKMLPSLSFNFPKLLLPVLLQRNEHGSYWVDFSETSLLSSIYSKMLTILKTGLGGEALSLVC